MGSTTVEFGLHPEFVKERTYNVTIGGKTAKIVVTREQNIGSMQKIMGDLQTSGKVEKSHAPPEWHNATLDAVHFPISSYFFWSLPPFCCH